MLSPSRRNRVRMRLGLAVAVVSAASLASFAGGPVMGLSIAAHAASEKGLSAVQLSLLGARQWLNTQPLSIADLRGKVILANFWTIPASIACARCPMSEHGQRNTRTADW